MMTLLIDLAPYGGGLIITFGAISAVLIQRNTADRREFRDRTIDRLEASLQAISDLKIWSLESLLEVVVLARDKWPEDAEIQPEIPVHTKGRSPKSHEKIIDRITLCAESSYDRLLNLIASYYPEQISFSEDDLGKRFNKYKKHATSTVAELAQTFNVHQVMEQLSMVHESSRSFNKRCNKLMIKVRQKIKAVHTSTKKP